MRYAGTSVLIVGAATGLGAAAAGAFALEGAGLTLVDRDGAKLSETVSRLRLAGASVIEVIGDAATQSTVDRAIGSCLAAHDAIDVLFNNAGIDPLDATTIEHTTETQWDAIMAVNVKSAFLFSRAVVPLMAARGKGAIINTSSIAGLKPLGDEVAYAVSKAALVQLTKSIAAHSAKDGIRVNCICPGILESVMADRAAAMSPEALVARAVLANSIIPMGRQGRYSEIAAAVLFLADPVAAAYITGVALPVDGGLLLL